MDYTTVRDVAKAISANNKNVEKRIDEAFEVVNERVLEVEKRAIEAAFEARQAANSTMSAVLNARNNRDLTPAYSFGKEYRVGDIIRHNGGVWQAFLDTKQAPGEQESGWVPYINGIASQRVEVSEVRELSFVTALSDGKVEKTDITMPIPLHHGKWEQGKAYDHGDMVMWDGCTWYSKTYNNTDEPPSGNWFQVAKQGDRGKPGEKGLKGDPGDRGAPGPQGPQGLQGIAGTDGQDADPAVAADILVKAFLGDEEAAEAIGAQTVARLKGLIGVVDPASDRIQLFSRGGYEAGTRYERGDLVSITGLGLFVALDSTVADPRTNSPDWQTLAVITQGGVSGGSLAAIPFTTLTDVPSSYVGQAGLFPRVNPSETGLIFDTLTPAVPVTMTPPLTPGVGDLWYASPFGQLMVWDGTFWVAA